MLTLSMTTMAWIVGVCVAAYLGVIVYAIAAPAKQHDPQRGVAVGCLMFAAVPGVALALLLAVGVMGGYEGLIRVLFYVTAVPMAYVLVLLIAQPIVRWRKNRNAWHPESEEPEQASEPKSGEAS